MDGRKVGGWMDDRWIDEWMINVKMVVYIVGRQIDRWVDSRGVMRRHMR